MASEVPSWLKALPLAPEYHPTLAEFSDPISYILKIEKEASTFGICKIVPPLPPPPKKTTISNLTHSFSSRDPQNAPTFTTRQQQIGFCPRSSRPVKKPVWQSGENYTLSEFEAKAWQFEKTHLRKPKKGSSISGSEVESLFWKACVDKPVVVEYANDMPGSGFGVVGGNGGGKNVGESAWNMRGVARAKGSLLRFMGEEIPGVTSPMVYVAMVFSWFAWHVEDHELHSLNYLHFGAGKTWYGVPRDAGLAFEEVVRVHGYGGEVNPLVTFAILAEKTTVMSPEVFVSAGIPCCRLVQNAGEFVVTFPGAYHSGFSHGFNCAEASNIATPEWLKVAHEAAVRRASTNYPPMVSHFQLLYSLALSLCSRMPAGSSTEPRSSRLKDKLRGEGEVMVKQVFVKNVIQNNNLLNNLLDCGSSCVVLPQNTSDCPLSSSLSQMKARISVGLKDMKHAIGFHMIEGNIGQDRNPSCVKNELVSVDTYSSNFDKAEGEKVSTLQCDGLLGQGLLSCVTCGILSFACVAIVQPKEAAATHFMSADCSSFNYPVAGNKENTDGDNVSSWKKGMHNNVSSSGLTDKHFQDGLQDNSVCFESSIKVLDPEGEPVSYSTAERNVSALDLLASVYENSSDSDEDSRDHSLESNVNRRSIDLCTEDKSENLESKEEEALNSDTRDPGSEDVCHGKFDDGSPTTATTNNLHSDTRTEKTNFYCSSSRSVMQRLDRDSSRMHVFCLKHALEVEKQVDQIGGVHIMLLCHPEYPKIEAEAKKMADELGISHHWQSIHYSEATKEDQGTIQMALEDEEAIPTCSDWTVKLGINLYYSANLSKSPLYSKQVPYNSIIYSAFHCNSPNKTGAKISTRQKKATVVGKWCGKVWMSNQVHPYLASHNDNQNHDGDETDTEQTSVKRKSSKGSGSSRIKSGKKRKVSSRRKSSTKKPRYAVEDTTKNLSEPLLQDETESRPSMCTRTGQGSSRRKSSTKKPRRSVEDTAENSSAQVLNDEILENDIESRSSICTRTGQGSGLKKPMKEQEAKGRKDYPCDVEGCDMSLGTKQDLILHKRNVCPVKGCRKKLFSHKYMAQHCKVHVDDRPLKCPWKGCKMAFKWPWARTEHLRVHTGDRPYICREPGCCQTFRFVSDFSRHKRKTGHSANKQPLRSLTN